MFDATNEIIRRITRYAAQLSEKNALGANRREEYRKVAELFLKCADLSEAQKMSAMVFGLERPFHLRGEASRETESMNRSVYEEGRRIDFSALPVLEPRVREILLKWLSDALEDGAYRAKTEDGRAYRLDLERAENNCVVHCSDGNFTMPCISIVFQE